MVNADSDVESAKGEVRSYTVIYKVFQNYVNKLKLIFTDEENPMKDFFNLPIT
jgi:hypothetical protein